MISFNFQRLLHTSVGRIIISILLGLGLSALFFKTCEGKHCIQFHGPVLSELDDNVYRHGEECYKYHIESTPCNLRKNIIPLASDTKLPHSNLQSITGTTLQK